MVMQALSTGDVTPALYRIRIGGTMDDQPILVTTAHRGVFFGYGRLELPANKQVVLRQARMCVYWPSATHGVLGLASDGPPHGSRVGPPAPVLILSDVTAVVEATSQAADRWEEGAWQN